jgi:preprotein translocase subunit SecE
VATAQQSTLVGEIFSGSIYKRNQGRLVRQATFFGLTAVALIGCVTMANTVLSDYTKPIAVGIPVAAGAIAAWIAYRIVNYPRFADFLIAVEGEMEKVSWPEWPYLWRALGVVLVVLVLFTTYMWFCDAVWVWLFNAIGFLDLDAINK